MRSGRISQAAEVYSYGVVLLEIMVNMFPCIVDPETGRLQFPLYSELELGKPSVAQEKAEAAADATARWPPELAAEITLLCLKCIDTSADCEAQRPLFNDICKALRDMQTKYFT